MFTVFLFSSLKCKALPQGFVHERDHFAPKHCCKQQTQERAQRFAKVGWVGLCLTRTWLSTAAQAASFFASSVMLLLNCLLQPFCKRPSATRWTPACSLPCCPLSALQARAATTAGSPRGRMPRPPAPPPVCWLACPEEPGSRPRTAKARCCCWGLWDL